MSLTTGQYDTSRRDFHVFIAGQFAAFCGNWMHRAAIGWLVWDLTRSPAWVGAVALVDMFTAPVTAVFAGAVVDRSNTFRLLTGTQLALISLSLVLWIFVHAGTVTIAAVILWAAIDSTLQGFNQPARMMAIGTLATRERMSQAIATNSVAVNLARAAGPSLAGLIILHGAVADVIVISALTSSLALIGLFQVRARLDKPGLAPVDVPLGRDIILGFRYALGARPVALMLFLAFSFALLARPFTELFPAIAGAVLQGGPATLAVLMSAQGVGALFGATWMLRRRDAARLSRISLAAGVGIGLALTGFALAPSPEVAIFCIGVAGLFHVTCNIGMQSLLQIVSRPEMRGRVVSLYGLVFRIGPAIGAFAMGVGARQVPLHWLIGGGGFIFAALVLCLFPHTRRTF